MIQRFANPWRLSPTHPRKGAWMQVAVCLSLGLCVVAATLGTESTRTEAIRCFDLAQAELRGVPGEDKKTELFDRIVEERAEAGDVPGVRAMVEAQAEATAKTDPEISRSKRRWNNLVIAKAQVHAGDIAGAKITIEALKDDKGAVDSMSWDIAAAQARKGDMAGARATVGTIADEFSRATAWRYIANAQAEAGDFLGARNTADAITDPYSKADALGAIVTELANRGDVIGAKQTYDHATHVGIFSHWIDNYSGLSCAIAEAQARAGDFAGAKATVKDMADYCSKDKVEALGEIAFAQARAGDVAASRQSLEEAKAVARIPNFNEDDTMAIALCVLADAQARVGDTKGAQQSYAQANDATNLIKEERFRSRALRDVAIAQATAKGLAAAELWTKTLADPFERAYSYAALATAHLQPEDYGVSRPPDVPGEAQVNPSTAVSSPNVPPPPVVPAPTPVVLPPGASPEETRRLEALRYLIMAQHAAKDVIDDPERAEVWTEIATVLTKAGDSDGARHCFAYARAMAEETTSDEKARWMAEVAVAQVEAGDPKGAMATVGSLEDEPGRSEARKELAVALAKAGDVAGAVATAKTIMDTRYLTWAWRDIALAQARAGDRTGARQSIEQAKAAFQAIKDESMKSGEWLMIARNMAEAGDVAGAIEWVNANSDSDCRARALREIVFKCADVGDVKGAMTATNTTPDGPDVFEELGVVAQAQTDAGDAAGARQTLEQATAKASVIKDKKVKDAALRDLATFAARLGNVAQAKAALETTAATDERMRILYTLVSIQAKAGDIAGARQSLLEAETIISANVFEDTSTWLGEIVSMQIAAGELEQAKATAAAIKNSDSKAYAQYEIGRAQAKTGDFAEATAAIEAAPEKWERIKSLRGLASAQAKTKGFPGAERWVGARPEPTVRAYGYITLAEVLLRQNGLKVGNDEE